METPEKKVDLRDIEPLRRVEDLETGIETAEEVERLGRTSAAVMGSTPAVGVEVESDERSWPADDDPLNELRR